MSLFTANNLIPLLFVAVGLVLIYMYFRNLAQVRSSEGWPASQGTILESWVRESTTTDDDGSTSSHYYPEVLYTYQVMGVEYQGDKLTFGPKSGGAQSKATRIVSNYPKGANVTVYYDPAKPSNAVLERNISRTLLIYGVIFLVIGVLFFIKIF